MKNWIILVVSTLVCFTNLKADNGAEYANMGHITNGTKKAITITAKDTSGNIMRDLNDAPLRPKETISVPDEDFNSINEITVFEEGRRKATMRDASNGKLENNMLLKNNRGHYTTYVITHGGSKKGSYCLKCK